MCKQTISPFSCIWIQCSIQSLFWNWLQIETLHILAKFYHIQNFYTVWYKIPSCKFYYAIKYHSYKKHSFSLLKNLQTPRKREENDWGKWLIVKSFLIKSVTFGSMTWATPSVPSNLSRAFNNTCHALDFPLPLGPTIIRPWWRFVIWNSCRTYNRKDTGFMLNLRKLEMQECISIIHVTNYN